MVNHHFSPPFGEYLEKTTEQPSTSCFHQTFQHWMKFRFINLHLWLNRAEWSWIVWCWRWMFPSLVKTSENRWCLTSGNNTMTPYPTPRKKELCKYHHPERLQRIDQELCQKILSFFLKSVFFFNEGDSNRKISEKEVNFTNHGMFVVRSSFFREEKLVVYKVQQRGLCPAAKLRGQGKGGCACRFLICSFLCHERHMFLHWGCA